MNLSGVFEEVVPSREWLAGSFAVDCAADKGLLLLLLLMIVHSGLVSFAVNLGAELAGASLAGECSVVARNVFPERPC